MATDKLTAKQKAYAHANAEKILIRLRVVNRALRDIAEGGRGVGRVPNIADASAYAEKVLLRDYIRGWKNVKKRTAPPKKRVSK